MHGWCAAWNLWRRRRTAGQLAPSTSASPWPLAYLWAAARPTCPWNPWHGAPWSASLRRATAIAAQTLQTLVSNWACSERVRAQAKAQCRACSLLPLQLPARRLMAWVRTAARCPQQELRVSAVAAVDRPFSALEPLARSLGARPIRHQRLQHLGGLAVACRIEAHCGAPRLGFQRHGPRAAAHQYAEGHGDALVLGASCPAVFLFSFHVAHHPCITSVESLVVVQCITLRWIAYAAELSDKPHAAASAQQTFATLVALSALPGAMRRSVLRTRRGRFPTSTP